MMGLSAYLIFVGIYSSGVSISEDINLRRSIRKDAIEEAKLLVSIGSAQMHQQTREKDLTKCKSKGRGYGTRVLEYNRPSLTLI